MKKKELEFFRKVLKQQLEELTQRSDATIAGLLNSTVNSADPLDRTSLELERDFTLRRLLSSREFAGKQPIFKTPQYRVSGNS
jgi:RNA polymerase-binding transcription factor DksA